MFSPSTCSKGKCRKSTRPTLETTFWMKKFLPFTSQQWNFKVADKLHESQSPDCHWTRRGTCCPGQLTGEQEHLLPLLDKLTTPLVEQYSDLRLVVCQVMNNPTPEALNPLRQVDFLSQFSKICCSLQIFNIVETCFFLIFFRLCIRFKIINTHPY